jgi:hypothetical protein
MERLIKIVHVSIANAGGRSQIMKDSCKYVE